MSMIKRENGERIDCVVRSYNGYNVTYKSFDWDTMEVVEHTVYMSEKDFDSKMRLSNNNFNCLVPEGCKYVSNEHVKSVVAIPVVDFMKFGFAVDKELNPVFYKENGDVYEG